MYKEGKDPICAGVSTKGQELAAQADALKAADCDKTVIETASGASQDRPKTTNPLN